MPTYLSPGVYVEEVPSGIQPIVAVGTSTAGIIGIIPDGELTIPIRYVREEPLKPGSVNYTLKNTPVIDTDPDKPRLTVLKRRGPNELIDVSATTDLELSVVDNVAATDSVQASSSITLSRMFDDTEIVSVSYVVKASFEAGLALKNEPKLCTNFSEFKSSFGDFSTNPNQNRLAHAVYGFFNNGGSRCFVTRIADVNDLDDALEKLAAVDEVAIVAAPGLTSQIDVSANAVNDKPLWQQGGVTEAQAADVRTKIVSHCQIMTQDRFAIFDSPAILDETGKPNKPELPRLTLSNPTNVLPDYTDYAALYYPWLSVSDPVTNTLNPTNDAPFFVPPSGHMAGVYARVDNTRGVHKAPANEVVLGAVGLKYLTSKAQQNGLNPQGVNCIRDLNGAIRIWGARTIGGDANGEWKYINIRRLFLMLRESIDEGTQWTVFEPNTPELWAKITRNITAFLNVQWRSGALFGTTAQEAFYVKCDAETNPPEIRDLGQVVTEIGVSPAKPAEFVIFRISQWAGPGS